MKNSKILFVLSLTSVLSFASGCETTKIVEHLVYPKVTDNMIITPEGDHIVRLDENNQVVSINDPATSDSSKIKSLSVRNESICLYYGDGKFESENIIYDVLPFGANTSTLKFESLNNAVATVDNSGKITAVKDGATDIKIKDENGTVLDTCHVVVNENTSAFSTFAIERKKTIATNQSKKDLPSKVFVRETYNGSKYVVNGETIEKTQFVQNMTISIEDAYFRINSEDEEAKCEGGSTEKSSVDYIFYTDELFFTYAIRVDRNSEAKNFICVDQAYLDDGKHTRYDALCEVIDNFFTSGSDIVTNQISDMTGEDELSSNMYWKTEGKYTLNACGYLEDDETQVSLDYTHVDGGPVGQADAQSLDIPVGTRITITDNIRQLWENNLTTYRHINETIAYARGGKNYEEKFIVDYFYDTKNVDLFKPDLKNAKKVDTLYDL